MDKHIEPLILKIKTTSSRDELIFLIDALLNSKKDSTSLANEALKNFLIALNITDLDLEESDLAMLRKDLLAIPIIKITLASMPSDLIIEKLHKVLCPINKPSCLDLTIVNDIKGGLIVYKSGKVIDLSLKTRIEKLFKQDAFKQKVSQLIQ